jgi:hypothetical protein
MADQFGQYYNKAEDFAGLGQYADAVSWYDKAIAINAKDADISHSRPPPKSVINFIP